MLVESLTVLAAAGGSAVATAAGTDAWSALRERMAALFGRGDRRTAQLTAERLDRAANELEEAAGDDSRAAEARGRLAAVWRARFEDLLESMDESERAEAAGRLRELVALVAGLDDRGTGTGTAVAGDGTLIADRVDVRATHGSFAAGTADVAGSVILGAAPPEPGADRA
ncbi:hypothetical protein ACF1A5_07925 [Streptomyces sp. NPDC014864]|uniref:hypothetical protein n=1 Tax=Streptomyces sp. NPDC014864 TaxID=3364924 RepID=UPI0036F578DB